MSGTLWLSIGAAVLATLVALLAVRARKSLNAPTVGPPFSDAVRAVLDAAQREARARGHNQVGPEHLLFAMCGVNDADTGDAADDAATGTGRGLGAADAVSLFAGDAVDMDVLRAGAERIMPPVGTPTIDGIELPYSARAHFALRAAVLRAGEMQHAQSELNDVVAGLLAEGRNSAARVMREAGVRM